MTKCVTAAWSCCVMAAIVWVALGAELLVSSVPADAEDEPVAAGQSYLNLYPKGDVYQVQVIGDYVAEGLKNGLIEAFRGDSRVDIKPKLVSFPTPMRSDFKDDLTSLEDDLGRDTAPVAVVMIGPQERTTLRVGPRKLWIDSDEWRAEFARQIDLVMKVLKRKKISVYWVSLPNVRRTEPNDDVQTLNEIIRERAVVNGMKYIDAYAGFADEGGGYSAMGPDVTGKIRLLREPNGVAFTEAGNRKLAHFVERELKRDLSQAKRDRVIPLVGGEAEQAAVAALRQTQQQRQARAAAEAAAAPSSAGSTAAATSAGAVGPGTASGDQKADNGRISLAIASASGREEVVTLDLLRPSIPATVIELVNRRDVAAKATTLGDLLIDKIPGGLIVMSSISPATLAEGRSRLPPTQTPYFRVIVKGERLPARTDRSDDFAWPQPEPPPVTESVAPAVEPAVVPRGPRRELPGRPKRAETDGVRVR